MDLNTIRGHCDDFRLSRQLWSLHLSHNLLTGFVLAGAGVLDDVDEFNSHNMANVGLDLAILACHKSGVGCGVR